MHSDSRYNTNREAAACSSWCSQIPGGSGFTTCSRWSEKLGLQCAMHRSSSVVAGQVCLSWTHKLSPTHESRIDQHAAPCSEHKRLAQFNANTSCWEAASPVVQRMAVQVFLTLRDRASSLTGWLALWRAAISEAPGRTESRLGLEPTGKLSRTRWLWFPEGSL